MSIQKSELTLKENGKPLNAYLASPPGGGPGVLVLPSWWGLKPFFKQVCDRLAEQGYVALAPDYYQGRIAHTIDEAKALQQEAELMQREFNYPARYVSAETVQQDHIGGTQSHGALRVPDALALHPLKLVHGVQRLARDEGATVHTASPVLQWNKRGAEHLLQTPSGTLRAQRVVLATNGYTPEHLHDCVRHTTLPALSHIIVTRPMTASEKQASRFFNGPRACASSGARPMKSMPDLSFTAQPRPASSGVWSGPISLPHAR